jgi:hypothetical protein
MKHTPPSSTPDFFTFTFSAAVGLYVVIASCKACGHRSQVYLKGLAEKYGKDAPTTRLQGRLRCTHCGARGPIIATLPKAATNTGQILSDLKKGQQTKQPSNVRDIKSSRKPR